MSTPKLVEVHVGDVVRLRKNHPCGGADFSVVRLGADIGLRCDRCEHRIMLPRSQFERRLKTFVSRAVAVDAAAPLPVPRDGSEAPSNEGSDSATAAWPEDAAQGAQPHEASQDPA